MRRPAGVSFAVSIVHVCCVCAVLSGAHQGANFRRFVLGVCLAPPLKQRVNLASPLNVTILQPDWPANPIFKKKSAALDTLLISARDSTRDFHNS